jgi:hypothetical protein
MLRVSFAEDDVNPTYLADLYADLRAAGVTLQLIIRLKSRPLLPPYSPQLNGLSRAKSGVPTL